MSGFAVHQHWLVTRRSLSCDVCCILILQSRVAHCAILIGLTQFLPRGNMQGRTEMGHITSKTPDISEYCDFDFYYLVWYHPVLRPNFNDENSNLGRWLGVSHRIVSDMCYWILKKSDTIIVETNVQHVTRDDMLDADTAAQVEISNSDIN